jgi:hypothetical protein
MSGKNQQKRETKNIAHAQKVWEREQIQAAAAQRVIEDAYAVIRANSEEIEPDKLALIEAEVAKRLKEIEDHLMASRDKYVAKVGAANAKLNG